MTRYRVLETRYRRTRPDIGNPISGHLRYREIDLRYRICTFDIRVGWSYRYTISKFIDIEEHELRYRGSISKYTDIEVLFNTSISGHETSISYVRELHINPFSKLDENVALNSGRPHRFGRACHCTLSDQLKCI